jgi:biopolymer transport protein ExbD
MKKGKRRVSIVLDMTPMVDIAFLLLIFYMATTQFKPPEQKDVALPVSRSERELPKSNYITVTVTALDSIFVDYIIKTKVWDETVGDSITVPQREYRDADYFTIGSVINEMRVEARKQGVKNLFIILKADRDANFGTIEEIMKNLQEAELSSFQVITDVEQTPIAPL